MGSLDCYDLGLTEFSKAWEFQEAIFLKVRDGASLGAWVICRHYPVVTKSRKSPDKNITASVEELIRKDIRVETVNRGGDATYHGPGQLMLYPVVPLRYFKKDIRLFIHYLEQLALGLLEAFGVSAELKYGLSGVWVKDKKIASIGIAVRDWISLHGMAINVSDEDLEGFRLVKPCGMDVSMTSIESVLKKQVDIQDVTLKLHELVMSSSETLIQI